MQLSHTAATVSSAFDDPNLVSSAGLVPVVRLAESARLGELVDEHLSVPTDKGSHAGLKVMSLVAGMVAGADSIDDMSVLRHGGMRRLFKHIYAPSTLGSFLRTFTFGHVGQLDAIASRFLRALTRRTPVLADLDTTDGYVMVDIDDTIVEVHGYGKQGSGYGYSGVRGINALIVTISAAALAPIIIGQRMRKGAVNSVRGASHLIADALANLRKVLASGTSVRVLLRADSAFYSHKTITAAIRAGADVSITAKLDPAVRAAIAAISDDAWAKIEYTHPVFDDETGEWVSRAEVAEIPFTPFRSKKKSQHVVGRLVVRRIPDLNKNTTAGQGALFECWRFHAFFTTSDLDTVTADATHRQHAIIEQVHADLKHSALAHLPSKSFAANSAWLVLAVIAFNLPRAAATTAGQGLAKATTGTIRRKLITIPARIATSARRIILHLPEDWHWETAWTNLFNRAGCDPPVPVLS